MLIVERGQLLDQMARNLKQTDRAHQGVVRLMRLVDLQITQSLGLFVFTQLLLGRQMVVTVVTQ